MSESSSDLVDCADKQSVRGQLRSLTEAELHKLSTDTTLVSKFKQDKLEKEAQKNWDIFYKRNTTKFFKDRHWTTREFQELCGEKEPAGGALRLLEVGCGVGNFIFPLLQEDGNMFFYACDFSPRAVQFVKENELYSTERCHAFQCDVTQNELSDTIPASHIDVTTLVFVLSAVHPDKMLKVLQNIHKVTKPGGCVLIRDYGQYDHAMLRFAPGHKLSDNFYVRQDGTRAYYFTVEFLTDLFEKAGFSTKSCDYILRQTVNKKEGLSVGRVFVQGTFVKSSPPESATSTDAAANATNQITSSDDKATAVEASIPTDCDITETDALSSCDVRNKDNRLKESNETEPTMIASLTGLTVCVNPHFFSQVGNVNLENTGNSVNSATIVSNVGKTENEECNKT